jgi:uncharacterized Tic20 family protein
MPVIFPPIPPFSWPPKPAHDPNPETGRKARLWAASCHLAGFLVLGVFSALLILPLIKWLATKGQHPFVEDQGKEAVNFQTTMLVGLAIMLVAPAPGLVVALLVLDAVFMVTAAREAHLGHHYRYPYPLTIIRLIK